MNCGALVGQESRIVILLEFLFRHIFISAFFFASLVQIKLFGWNLFLLFHFSFFSSILSFIHSPRWPTSEVLAIVFRLLCHSSGQDWFNLINFYDRSTKSVGRERSASIKSETLSRTEGKRTKFTTVLMFHYHAISVGFAVSQSDAKKRFSFFCYLSKLKCQLGKLIGR